MKHQKGHSDSAFTAQRIPYMREALRLAARARGRTSPNPMVGAVLVREGRIVGKGYHKAAGLPHAEVEAIRDAGKKARGAELFVTLEPCCHFGRTPPCTHAILDAGITHIVAAHEDPNPRVHGRGIKWLRERSIVVDVGLLEKEARRLNEIYEKYITTSRPFVALKMALSLDGKIATRTGKSQWLSSEASRRYVHRLRGEYDAVMVGSGTVLADNPQLACRLPGASRQPIRIVVDSRGRVPLDARALGVSHEHCARPPVLAITRAVPAHLREAWGQRGVEVLLLHQRAGHVDLADLMAKLGAHEITSVLLEGGGTLAEAALQAGIVDKVFFFLCPLLLGGEDAPTALRGRGVAHLAQAWRLRDLRLRRLGEDVLIEAAVAR